MRAILAGLCALAIAGCVTAPKPPAPSPTAPSKPTPAAGRLPAAGQRTNDAGERIIKKSESLQLESYELGGSDFIGYGHLQKQGEPDRITEAQAEALLRADLGSCEAAVAKAATGPITNNEFSAMVSLCYNIGTGNFATSTVVRELNAGDRKAAADAFRLWNKSGGAVLDRLTARRNEERDLFLKP